MCVCVCARAFSLVFQVWKEKLTCSKHAFRLSENTWVTRAVVEPHSAYIQCRIFSKDQVSVLGRSKKTSCCVASSQHQLWRHPLHTLKEKAVTHTDSSCLDSHVDWRSLGVETASAGKLCELFCVYIANHFILLQ